MYCVVFGKERLVTTSSKWITPSCLIIISKRLEEGHSRPRVVNKHLTMHSSAYQPDKIQHPSIKNLLFGVTKP